MIVPTLALEKSLWQKGYRYIIGIDEVGRGSWAGPLVVAGVIFPEDIKVPEGLADSKLLKPSKRVKIARIIKNIAVATSIVEIPSRVVDKIRLAKATQVAFRKVIKTIDMKPDYCLIDAFYIRHFSRSRQQAVKNGDKICASIAAASVIAKVYRDNLMKKLHFQYPDYGFGRNKGYGTKQHQDAIKMYGLTKIHRRSFNINYLLA